jgi:hypothetical protein
MVIGLRRHSIVIGFASLGFAVIRLSLASRHWASPSFDCHWLRDIGPPDVGRHWLRVIGFASLGLLTSAVIRCQTIE